MKDISELLESLELEWNQLDGRLERLNNFIFSDDFKALSVVTKLNLRAQSSIMAAYSCILRARMREHDYIPRFLDEEFRK